MKKSIFIMFSAVLIAFILLNQNFSCRGQEQTAVIRAIPENYQSDCIFCNIIIGKEPATIIAETDDLLVFENINKLPGMIRWLIIPKKKHIKDIQSMKSGDFELGQKIFKMAQELGKKVGKDFKLTINSGQQAGQVIFHVHMHFEAYI